MKMQWFLLAVVLLVGCDRDGQPTIPDGYVPQSAVDDVKRQANLLDIEKRMAEAKVLTLNAEIEWLKSELKAAEFAPGRFGLGVSLAQFLEHFHYDDGWDAVHIECDDAERGEFVLDMIREHDKGVNVRVTGHPDNLRRFDANIEAKNTEYLVGGAVEAVSFLNRFGDWDVEKTLKFLLRFANDSRGRGRAIATLESGSQAMFVINTQSHLYFGVYPDAPRD